MRRELRDNLFLLVAETGAQRGKGIRPGSHSLQVAAGTPEPNLSDSK